MKVLAINGSMKEKNSCTDMILQPFLSGMQKAGAEVETIYLAKYNVKHCTGCMSCWFKTVGKCTIADDMYEISNKLLETDLVIYATPVYFRSTTGLMKDFLDRTMPLGVPYHTTRYWDKVKKFLISPCGYPDFDEFTLLVDLFKKSFGNKYIGEILRPGADLMHWDEFKPQYKKYCDDLETAGIDVVENGEISAKTKSALNTFWVSPAEHLKVFKDSMTNSHLNSSISDNKDYRK